MSDLNDHPSSAMQDPVEGSREIIERELERQAMRAVNQTRDRRRAGAAPQPRHPALPAGGS